MWESRCRVPARQTSVFKRPDFLTEPHMLAERKKNHLKPDLPFFFCVYLFAGVSDGVTVNPNENSGQVACFGQNANEAFLKALIASGVKVTFEPCGYLGSDGGVLQIFGCASIKKTMDPRCFFF